MGLALGLMLLGVAIVMCYIAFPRDDIGLLNNWGGLAELYVVLLIVLFCFGGVLVLSALS